MLRDNGNFTGNGKDGTISSANLSDLVQSEHELWSPEGILAKEYLQRIETGELPVPLSAAELLYAAVTTPPPFELDSGLLEYPFFAGHP